MGKKKESDKIIVIIVDFFPISNSHFQNWGIWPSPRIIFPFFFFLSQLI